MDTRPHRPPRSIACTHTRQHRCPGAGPAAGGGLPGAAGAPRPPQGSGAASCEPPARCTGTGEMAQHASSSHAAALPAGPGGPGGLRSHQGGKLGGTAPSWAADTMVGGRDPCHQPGASQRHRDLSPPPRGWLGGVPRHGTGWQGCSRAPDAPPQPPRPRRHSRRPSILHALGAEARLGQQRAQQPSSVGVPRGVVAAGRWGSEPAPAGGRGTRGWGTRGRVAEGWGHT